MKRRCAIKEPSRHLQGRRPRERRQARSLPDALERAAQILRAMGDGPRLRILDLLKQRERCVTEIVAAVGEKFTTVSQRLKLLRGEGLIVRRRDGNHIYYALADRHVVDLILNALAHATELDASPAPYFPGRRRLTWRLITKATPTSTAPTAGTPPSSTTATSITCTTATCTTRTAAEVEEHVLAVSTHEPGRLHARPRLRRSREGAISTAPAAATRRSRTATTSITWWTVTCTTRTAITATTTARFK